MTDRNSVDPGTDISDLEADIEQTRRELGDTVEALAEKLDVKSHLKSSAEQARSNAVDAITSNWRELAIVGVWAVVVTLAWKKL